MQTGHRRIPHPQDAHAGTPDHAETRLQNIVDEFEQALAQLAVKPEVRHVTPNLQPATDPNLG